jgi:hypothetical protein
MSREVQNRTRHVYYGEKRGTTENNYFQIFKLNRFLLSIKAHVVLDQINPALNREGVELTFHQSYRFEITTNPLGKQYITS